MNLQKAPRSLRFEAAVNSLGQTVENNSGKKVSAVAGLIAVASFSGAEAQQSNLPPVTVDAPVARPRPAASKPSPDQLRARTALRRAARRAQPAQVAAVPFPNAAKPGRRSRSLRGPAAPYKADRVQASGKFPEPLLNTPKTITVLTRRCSQDKNITSLREIGARRRRDAGRRAKAATPSAIGSSSAVSMPATTCSSTASAIPPSAIRENFFTEQIEILRGPASSYAGRGTAGGAINIVTKQASDRNFYNAESKFGTDHTKRVTFDVNQVIRPTLSVRIDGMFQDANVAGRNYMTDDRWGGLSAMKWTPTNDFTVRANYVHTDLTGCPISAFPTTACNGAGHRGRHSAPDLLRVRRPRLPDARRTSAPSPANTGSPMHHAHQRIRDEHSILDYIGTLPNATVDGKSQSAEMDVHREPAEPQPVGRHPGEPGRRRIQVRHGGGQAHGGRRVEISNERSGSTAIPGFRRKRLATPARHGASAGQSSMRRTTRLPVRHSGAIGNHPL